MRDYYVQPEDDCSLVEEERKASLVDYIVVTKDNNKPAPIQYIKVTATSEKDAILEAKKVTPSSVTIMKVYLSK